MAVNEKHPLYTEFKLDWDTMRDTYRGERVVKQKGEIYLPIPSGMLEDGARTPNTSGWNNYNAYKTRAVFHDFVSEAVEILLGIMHSKPPTIELPPQMEFLREKATIQGESLEQLLVRINEAQLTTGRLGLLMDMPATPQEVPQPYIAIYKAEDILNWDDGRRDEITLQNLNLVVLSESEYERQMDLTWKWEDKHRVLVLGDPTTNEPAGTNKVYMYGVFKGQNATFSIGQLQTPTIRGTPSKEIPFVFINSKDTLPNPDDPPLIGLAKLVLAIYRGEADYRHTLFMQGQDTLVISGGGDEDVRVGAGAKINLPIGGKAEYIGIGHLGLSEQRQALENDKKQAGTKGAQLIDSMSREKESGEALQIRIGAKTATLNQIAKSAANGLQTLLRIAARWMGADENKVIVTPNLDFSDAMLSGKDLVDIMSAKNLGLPLSTRSIHALLVARRMTEMDFDTEMGEIETEEPLGIAAMGVDDGTEGSEPGGGNQPGA